MESNSPPFFDVETGDRIADLLEALTNLLYLIKTESLDPQKVCSHAAAAERALSALQTALGNPGQVSTNSK